jgi:glutamate synthase domain-containing protein 3
VCVEDEQLLAVHAASKSTGTGMYGGAIYIHTTNQQKNAASRKLIATWKEATVKSLCLRANNLKNEKAS